MTPSIPKSKETVACEKHMRECPQCSKDPNEGDSSLCEEGFRLLQEAILSGRQRREGRDG